MTVRKAAMVGCDEGKPIASDRRGGGNCGCGGSHDLSPPGGCRDVRYADAQSPSGDRRERIADVGGHCVGSAAAGLCRRPRSLGSVQCDLVEQLVLEGGQAGLLGLSASSRGQDDGRSRPVWKGLVNLRYESGTQEHQTGAAGVEGAFAADQHGASEARAGDEKSPPARFGGLVGTSAPAGNTGAPWHAPAKRFVPPTPRGGPTSAGRSAVPVRRAASWGKTGCPSSMTAWKRAHRISAKQACGQAQSSQESVHWPARDGSSACGVSGRGGIMRPFWLASREIHPEPNRAIVGRAALLDRLEDPQGGQLASQLARAVAEAVCRNDQVDRASHQAADDQQTTGHASAPLSARMTRTSWRSGRVAATGTRPPLRRSMLMATSAEAVSLPRSMSDTWPRDFNPSDAATSSWLSFLAIRQDLRSMGRSRRIIRHSSQANYVGLSGPTLSDRCRTI